MTDEEIEVGVAWLLLNGFKHYELADGKLRGWEKKSKRWKITLHEPRKPSGWGSWWVTATPLVEMGQLNREGMSMGDFTTVQEAVEDARSACFRPMSERQMAIENAVNEMVPQVLKYLSTKKRKTTRRRS